ncbi:MAG: DMT family transporter [Rhodospirillales bacterium]|nr:DMT family transporter [Rhodospirillales bacterium]
MTTPASPLRGVILIAAAATVWSIGGLIVRLVQAGDFEVIFWRTAFAGLFLSMAVASQGPRTFWTRLVESGWYGILASVMYAATFTLYILSLRRTTVAHTQIIICAAPFVAALLAWPILGERVRPRTWVTIAVVFAGVGVMLLDSLDGGGLTGDLLAVVLAVILGGIPVVLRKARTIELVPTVAVSGILAAVLVWPVAEPFAIAPSDMALLAIMGFAQLGFGLLLFVRGLRHLPAAEVQLLAMLETVLAPIWVWITIGEEPTRLALGGGAVVLIALAVHFAIGLLRPDSPEKDRPIA